MINGNLLVYDYTDEIEKLKKRMINLQSNLDTLIEKNIILLKLVGTDKKVPELIINKQKEIDKASIWLFKTLPTIYIGNTRLNTPLVKHELSSYEMSYYMNWQKYGEILDELIALYLKKNASYANISHEDNVNYKLETMKMLDIFHDYGITDANFIKFDVGIGVIFEEREKECIESLREIINNLGSTEITELDFLHIKEILVKLSRIRILDEKMKNDVYNNIEEYISELSERRSYQK